MHSFTAFSRLLKGDSVPLRSHRLPNKSVGAWCVIFPLQCLVNGDLQYSIGYRHCPWLLARTRWLSLYLFLKTSHFSHNTWRKQNQIFLGLSGLTVDWPIQLTKSTLRSNKPLLLASLVLGMEVMSPHLQSISPA